MCEIPAKSSDRRFRRRCQIGCALSLMLYMLCSQASLRVPQRAISLTLAALAGASFFAELVSFGLLATRLRDEFQRILLMRSFIWATLITMGLSTVWGFVELHGHGTVPHLDIIWIPIILICLTAAAKVMIFRQYRTDGE